MSDTVDTPPIGELGGTSATADASRGLALFRGAIMSGNEAFEASPAWRWPKRVDTIDAMRRNSQVQGLEGSVIDPIRKWPWRINPNGARDEVVRFVADNLGLPVAGDEDVPKRRSRGRFSWHQHLRLALRAPSYGAAWFEQVARLDPDGKYRLAKLAPRPLRTITKVNVARDGGLVSIEQGMLGGKPVEIPVDRLVAYIHDADPGSWSGNSRLRPLYLHTWMIDKLYRIEAMKHERYGAPMVVFETPPEVTDAQKEALTLMAQAVRAGESAGGSVPAGTKTHLIGASGAGTDVRASIDGHLQDMARAWNVQVTMLAQAGTSGNRALGGTFADIMFAAQLTVADDLLDVANAHIVEDLVDWNWGPDEPCPLIEYDADPALATSTLLEAIDKGLVQVDPETENWWRGMNGMPIREVAEDGGSEVFAYDQTNGVVTIDEARARKAPPLPPRTDGLGSLTVPEFLAAIKGSTPADALEGDLTPTELEPVEVEPVTARGPFGRTLAAARRVLSSRWRVKAADDEPSSDPMLPDRNLRRQRTATEIAAATDFRRLDESWDDAVAVALAAWEGVQAEQREAIIEAIEDANGDLVALANLEAPVIGAAVIEAAIRTGIEDGIESATAEAAAQGVSGAAKPDIDDAITDIPERAEAMAVTMARSYGEVAGRYAMLAVNTGGDVATTVTSVTTRLEALTDTFLRDQIGAAVQGGQNAGRFAAFEAQGVDKPPTYHSSEILDGNTCGPCKDEDGTTYDSLEAAMDAYPLLGAFVNCEGGERCRGSVVATFDEAGATVSQGDDD